MEMLFTETRALYIFNKPRIREQYFGEIIA